MAAGRRRAGGSHSGSHGGICSVRAVRLAGGVRVVRAGGSHDIRGGRAER
jgi:hypothetical protein